MRETKIRPPNSSRLCKADIDGAAAPERQRLVDAHRFVQVERLITSANDPTDNGLNLPFHDFDSRSTDLEAQDCLEPHLTSLHDVAGDQPLVAETTVTEAEAITWPRISVVVCSHNGARTIGGTLDGLVALDYPAYEVIVVDDGSTDDTASIIQRYGYRLINSEYRGRGHARNLGMQAAHGEVVAYLDDDVCPDSRWLRHLATTFVRTHHAGVGGPSLASDSDSWLADCMANAPGGPVHVLLSDRGAEHIPGANMAFRKSTLQSIGGFDPRYRTGGEDVDVCWRLQQRGWTLGFHPSAVVWHHRDPSVRRYWNQQWGYGFAEALLEEKWPLTYNEFGHLAWAGRLDGKGLTRAINARQGHIYQGTWHHALWQRLREPAPSVLCMLPLMPAWYLLVSALAVLAVLGFMWPLLRYSLPLLALMLAVPLGQAALSAKAAVFTCMPSSRLIRLKCRLTTAFLHVLQPMARLYGRLNQRLTRWRGHQRLALVWPRTVTLGREVWPHDGHLPALETALRDATLSVQPSREGDGWDLEVRGGLFGKVRTRTSLANAESDKPMIQFRSWPVGSAYGVALGIAFTLLAVGAVIDQAYVTAAVLGGVSIFIAYRVWQECAWAMSGLLDGLKRLGASVPAATPRYGATPRQPARTHQSPR